MIQINLAKAETFLEQDTLTKAKDYSAKAFKDIQNASVKGSEMLGWRRILSEPNDAEVEEISRVANAIREQVDVFIVCGIGGSYLGAKALIEALTPYFNQESSTQVIFAGYHLGGKYLKELVGYLEEPKPDGTPKQVGVNVMSKSGTTLETMLSFRVLREWMHKNFPDTANERIICTTSREGGILNDLADKYNYRKFVIPDDTGGRYSVLTPVGLLPAAAAGIDIHTLFYEAVSAFEKLETDPDNLLDYAAVRYAFEQSDKTVDVISSFEPNLNGLCRWMQQLLGESEGKNGRGLFPVVAQYSSDLHSLGQFMQQGTPCMLETFIEVKNGNQAKSITVQNSEQNTDQLNYLVGQTFHQINQKALRATRAAHSDGGVPCITVTMDRINEQSLGEFIYFYELFTAVYCSLLGVNSFNQPGVENYKSNMYKILGKSN